MGADDQTKDDPKPPRFPRRRTNVSRAAEHKANMTNWRERMDPAKLKFTDERKVMYCQFLANTGRKAQAAASVDVTVKCVREHREKDPEFNDAVMEAEAAYADKVHALAYSLMEGVKKPIIGGKNKDEIVAFETVHATNLMAMEMKMTNPNYKERQEIDVNQKGALLIVPADEDPADYVARLKAEAEHAVDPRLAAKDNG